MHEVALDLSGTEQAQRQWVYVLRDDALDGRDLTDIIAAQLAAAIEGIVGSGGTPSAVLKATRKLCTDDALPPRESFAALTDPQVMARTMTDSVRAAYGRRRSRFSGVIDAFERRVLATVIDIAWAAHLARLETAYPQLDPRRPPAAADLDAYRRAASESESLLRASIARDTTGYLFHTPPG